MTASAQDNFSAKANALRQQYQTEAAKTRAAGEASDTMASFVVICKSDASPVAVGERLKALGATVSGVFGRSISVSIPVEKIDAMAQTEGVLLVDAGTKGDARTDTSRKVTQADEVISGKGAQLPQAYTGKGVVIGLIDSGFDFTHPGFKDKDGNLRIKAAYLAGNTEVPQEKVTVTKTDKTGASTQVELQPGIVTDPKVILDTLKVRDHTNDLHGTHCAYITAGTPIDGITGNTGGLLGGMAPDAELIFCMSQPNKELARKYAEDATITHSSYFDFLKYYAQKNDKELVLSWSENNHLGWHNGTSPMAQLCGDFAKDNVMMLCSGNEGDSKLHVHRNVAVGDSLNFAMISNTTKGIYYLKSTKAIRVRVGFYDYVSGKELYSFPLTIDTGKQASDTIVIRAGEIPGIEEILATLTPEEKEMFLANQAEVDKYVSSGYVNVFVSQGTALESSQSDKTFAYTEVLLLCNATFKLKDEIPYGLTLHITPVEEEAEAYCWSDNCLLAKSGIYEVGTDDCSVGDFNTSGLPVTVGAYIANNVVKTADGKSNTDTNFKTIGDIAQFSSYGTDLAGHKYPDLCTPGTCIYSAVNSFYPDSENHPAVARKAFTGQFEGQTTERTYEWCAADGTSMSTPVSAGIVALWLQAARDKGKKLTSADIKEIAAKTSDNDEFTQAKPERFGSGKLNAYKGLLYVLGLYDPSGISTVSTHQPAGATFRLSGDLLYADGVADGTPVSLYNLQGVLVGQTTVEGGAVSLAGLQKGVYAVQLDNLGSTLIRK